MKRHPQTIFLVKRAGSPAQQGVAKFNNFADGDTHCLIEGGVDIAGSKVLVRHYLYPDQNEQIVRLLFLVGTLSDLGAKSIEVFVPYLPYARQDKAHLPGEILSGRLLCRLLRVSGVNALHTIDCHFMKGAPKTEIEGLTIYNRLVQDRLVSRLETLTAEQYSIIGPDSGASYLAQGVTMKKKRAAEYQKHDNGSIHRAVERMDDEHLVIAANTLVVADDMVSTGATMIKALEAVKARGVSDVYAMTSHGLFLGDSLDTITRLTKGVIYSDTVAQEGSVPVVEEVFADIARERF